MTYAKDMTSDSQRLAAAVARLNRRLRQERQSDLTASQLSVLGAVRELDAATPGQIAARERVRPPSITRTLNCLEEDGYVERRPHPQDGRQVVLVISDRGEDVLAAERARRDAWLDSRLAALGEDEREILRRAVPVLQWLTEDEPDGGRR